ncbi:MAG: hypothetical protein ABI155_14265 [Paralcaligenes sp.]
MTEVAIATMATMIGTTIEMAISVHQGRRRKGIASFHRDWISSLDSVHDGRWMD